MKRGKFTKKGDIKAFLDRNPYYFAIESIESNRLFYITDGEKIIMTRDSDAVMMNVKEMPKESEKFITKIKDEMLDIYADIKDYKRMGLSIERN